jgi:hypothetical protein
MDEGTSKRKDSIYLSSEVSLVYVLSESGVRGQLTSGRIERNGLRAVDVFDARGEWFEYLSGEKVRSWCVMGPKGEPIDGWREILPEDLPKIIPGCV